MKELETGWVSPDGEFVYCSRFGHSDAAKEIFEKIYGDLPKYECWVVALQKKGWISIHLALYRIKSWVIGGYQVTGPQREFLRPYENSFWGLDKDSQMMLDQYDDIH